MTSSLNLPRRLLTALGGLPINVRSSPAGFSDGTTIALRAQVIDRLFVDDAEPLLSGASLPDALGLHHLLVGPTPLWDISVGGKAWRSCRLLEPKALPTSLIRTWGNPPFRIRVLGPAGELDG